jgi:hypothetical protein
MVLADTKEGHTGHLVFEKKRFMRRVGQPQEVVRSFVNRRSFRVFSSRRRRWNGMNAAACLLRVCVSKRTCCAVKRGRWQWRW